MTDLPVPYGQKRVVVVLVRLEALLTKQFEILERFEAKYLKVKRIVEVPPMPDVVDYGLWDCKDISGIWGTGTHYKKVGFLAYTANYNCHTQSNTTIYHEFTKWLFKNPRNRNFWMTGNCVEVYRHGKLTKEMESEFRAKHAGVLKSFFEDFCADREEDLLEEAEKALGEKGAGLLANLFRYIANKEFTNPKADSLISNSVCKSTIKQIRNHLREKKLDSE